MAMQFKKGDVVKVATVVPSGPVQAFRMDDDGVIYCLIEWVDTDGKIQKRWFDQASLVAA